LISGDQGAGCRQKHQEHTPIQALISRVRIVFKAAKGYLSFQPNAAWITTSAVTSSALHYQASTCFRIGSKQLGSRLSVYFHHVYGQKLGNNTAMQE
jgi:hypothetical protein